VILSNFYCERCREERTSESGPKGVLEHTILPLFLISHVRCHYCGDRYAAFGIGKNRIVFRRTTTLNIRKLAVVLLCASLAAAAAFLILR